MDARAIIDTPDASLYAGGSEPVSRINTTAVRFETRPVHNAAKSTEEGRPIYDATEYIEIRVPGDKQNIVHRPVRDADRQKYAQQYAAWKAGEKQEVSGTPLSMWPPIRAEQVLELQHFGVRTVEELAGVADSNLTNLGPYRTLRDQAKAWMEAAKGHAPVARLAAENEALRLEVAGLREQMKGLESALTKAKGKG